MAGPSLSMTLTNYSDHELTKWFVSSALTFNETLNNKPSNTIKAHSGHTKMAASQSTLSAFGTDVYCILMGYHVNGMSFGIRCDQKAQVFGIGSAPTYSWCSSNKKWHEVDDSSIHTWTGNGVVVTATPTVQHDSISVDIIVKNAS
ncbi:MAG: hypothetical protein AAGK66_01665 [Pseudomonadota bacterium]